jgi:hypothetical protein
VNLSEYIAVALLVLAAVSVHRKSPLVAISLLVAWAANAAYDKGIVTNESIRWVSTVVGACGAFEFGRGVERMKHQKTGSIRDALRSIDGASWIGLVLLASMGVDGFGMIVFRLTEVWIVPEATIGILVLVVGIGLFGKEGA